MIKKVLKWGGIAVLVFFVLAILGGGEKDQDGVSKTPDKAGVEEMEDREEATPDPEAGAVTPLPSPGETRSFRMGFSPWPPDVSIEAVNEVYAFIHEHADLVFHHFENIPWVEAYEGEEFSENLMGNWEWRKAKTPKSHAVLLGIGALNFNRDGLAPYWGEVENMTLPDGWEDARFNDEKVKTAYLNFVVRAVEYFNPDYLSIGSEVNMYAARRPERWNEYLEFNRYVYTELKKKYPNLTIFASIQYDFLRGIEPETKGKRSEQVARVKELLTHSDIIALTTYQYGEGSNPVTDDFFSAVPLLGAKPVAISEMGAMSIDTKIGDVTLRASGALQERFVRMMLEYAKESRLLFVNNYIPIDYDELAERLSAEFRKNEAAKAWMHSGLVDTERNEKPALATWDVYLALPYAR